MEDKELMGLIPDIKDLGEPYVNEDAIKEYGEQVIKYNSRRWLFIFGLTGNTLKVLLGLFEKKGYKVTRSDTANNKRRYKVEW